MSEAMQAMATEMMMAHMAAFIGRGALGEEPDDGDEGDDEVAALEEDVLRLGQLLALHALEAELLGLEVDLGEDGEEVEERRG